MPQSPRQPPWWGTSAIRSFSNSSLWKSVASLTSLFPFGRESYRGILKQALTSFHLQVLQHFLSWHFYIYYSFSMCAHTHVLMPWHTHTQTPPEDQVWTVSLGRKQFNPESSCWLVPFVFHPLIPGIKPRTPHMLADTPQNSSHSQHFDIVNTLPQYFLIHRGPQWFLVPNPRSDVGWPFIRLRLVTTSLVS